MNDGTALPTGMAWHIFKKDWRLLWPLVLIGTVLNALLAVLRYHSASYSDEDALAAMLTLGLLVTTVLTLLLVVQQDAIPGVQQDWLVRPIKRRDLLGAKLLAVALLVHAPMALCNLLQGIAEGFPFAPMLRAALLGAVEVALIFTLPVMAIGALTKNLAEALVSSLVLFLGLVLTYLLITRVFHLSSPTHGTGVAWIAESLSHVLLLTATASVLLLQYFRRSTVVARAVFIGGLGVFLLASRLPWAPAFAIQTQLSSDPESASPVSVEVDADGGKRTANPEFAPVGSSLFVDPEQKKKKKVGNPATVVIYVPLQFAGIGAGRVLHVDRTLIRLTDAGGSTLFRGAGGVFDVPPSMHEGPAALRQAVEIPAAVYRQAADRPLRLQVDYSFTLLLPHALPTLSAIGHRRLPAVGDCVSHLNQSTVEVSCRTAGEEPPCVSVDFADAVEIGSNTRQYVCSPNYQPAALRFSPDPIDHLEAKLPMGDHSNVPDVALVLRVYEPQAHFSRRLIVPAVQLREWQALPAR